MKRRGIVRKIWEPLRGVLPAVALFAAVAAILLSSLKAAEAASTAEEKRLAEESLTRAAVSCYAIEGRYPESYAYIREHYGVLIDEDKFQVDYRIFASNIMPDITVWEVGA
jgi:hypothetical protein